MFKDRIFEPQDRIYIMANSLFKKIKYFKFNKDIIEGWNNLTPYLIHPDSGIYKDKITNQLANVFVGDFFGLLKYKYDLDPDYWYPHLIVNNLNSPSEYDGLSDEIVLIPIDVCDRLLSSIK